MIILAAALIGILLGIRSARRRGGNRLDMWQYGAVYGILFALGGLALTVLAARIA